MQLRRRRADFHALDKALKTSGGSELLTYYAFDLLYLDGLDLRPASLLDRKRVPAELLADVMPPIRYSEHLVVNIDEEFRGMTGTACCAIPPLSACARTYETNWSRFAAQMPIVGPRATFLQHADAQRGN